MDAGLAASWIGGTTQIFFLDLLLSGDNAVVIALACRALPARDVPRAICFGTLGAILLRLLLTTVAGWLIALPYLQLISSFLLLIIAVNLTRGEAAPLPTAEAVNNEDGEARGRLLTAIMVVVFADAIMSLDNIVALAAVSRGNLWLLGAGLGLRMPLLIYGGVMLTHVLKNYPALISLGGAVLGWTAGDLAANDPILVNWITKQAPALIYVLPISGAIYVLMQQSITKREPVVTKSYIATGAIVSAPNRPPLPAMARGRQSDSTPVAAAQSVRLENPKVAQARMPVAPLKTATPEARAGEDRIMLFGLVGLFILFGFFIGFVLMVGGSFHAGG